MSAGFFFRHVHMPVIVILCNEHPEYSDPALCLTAQYKTYKQDGTHFKSVMWPTVALTPGGCSRTNSPGWVQCFLLGHKKTGQ